MLVRGALLLVTAMVAASTSPAESAAAPPPNDLLANATVITSLPFTGTLDTTGATADADDAKAITPCFPTGVTSHNSVWYSYTAETDTELVADASDSSFDTGVTIAVGDLDDQPVLSCTFGPIPTRMHVPAGETASILAYATNEGGGTLDLRVFGAVVPPNDTAAGAARIDSIPFTDETYVGLATSDAQDEQAAQACGIGSTPNSVWYAFTAVDDEGVVFDTTRTTPFPTERMIVATGSPGALTPVSCDVPGAFVETTPGTTYYAIVYWDSTLLPNRLRFDAYRPPPPATGIARFAERGIVDPSGNVHLMGSYECADAMTFNVIGSITQRRGPRRLNGPFGAPETSVCDGQLQALQVTIEEGEGRRFEPGKASLEFRTIACNARGCVFGPSVTKKVFLQRARSASSHG